MKLLFNQRKLRCYEPVELIYYYTGTVTEQRRGNRVITKNVCCICYADTDIAPPDKVKRWQKSDVQNSFPDYRSCLDLNVQAPDDRTNLVKKREQAKAKREALSKEATLTKKGTEFGKKKRRRRR